MSKSIVSAAKERFAYAKSTVGKLRQQAIEDTRFALGDSDNNWQYPDEIVDARSKSQKPCLTINITAQHLNQVENQIRQNRPSARVVPIDGGADVKTAEILGGMLRSIQSYSNADTAHDIGAKHALYGGEGFWRVLTDYETSTSFDQVVAIKPLVNPQLVYVDPDAIEPDRSDAKWGIIFEDVPQDDRDEDEKERSLEWGEDDGGWCNKETFRRAEYFWREDRDDTLYLLHDGTTALKSKLIKGKAKIVVKEKIGTIQLDDQIMLVIDERPTTRQQWKWAKIVGGDTDATDVKDWPGAYLPIITVVGNETNVNGEIVRKGLVRDLKDSARMVNYSYSAAVETVALQTKTPWLTSAESVEGHDEWDRANVDNASRLNWNAFDDNGQPLPKPERIAPAAMATAQVQMLSLSVEQMRAASGQQNANFGIRSEAQSGVGIQRLKAQGEIATFHFPDNLARALKYEAKVVLDLIPKVYDSKRIIRILGLDGKESAVMADPDHEGGAQKAGPDTEVEQIFNPLVGRYDVAIDTGPSYQTQRQEAAAAMTELSSRAPVLMQVAPDLVVGAFDFPNKEQLAQRLRRTVPAQLLGDEDEMQAKLQQQVEQQAQQLQQMQEVGQGLMQEHEQAKQELEQLKREKAAGFYKEEAENMRAEQENGIEQYKAETARIAALAPVAPALDPVALQALVRDTIMQMLQEPAPPNMIPPEMAGAAPLADPGLPPVPQEGMPV